MSYSNAREDTNKRTKEEVYEDEEADRVEQSQESGI